MVFKDEVYLFLIDYYGNEESESNGKYIYSNTGNIYELEDVPEKTYNIYCYYQDLTKNNGWKLKDEYIVGDELTLEEAGKEIKTLEEIPFYQKHKADLKNWTLERLKNYCKNEKNDIRNADDLTIYINKNINYREDIHIRIRALSASECEKVKVISPKQIVHGRIYSPEQLKFLEKENPNTDSDKSYIELE